MESLFLKCMAILGWKVGRNLYNTFFFNLLGTNPPNQDMCVSLYFGFYHWPSALSTYPLSYLM